MKCQKNTGNNSHIKKCIQYLLSLDDNEFNKIYVNLPISSTEYENNILAGSNLDDTDDDDDDDKYTLLDYAFAYASDINLIRRCLDVSPVAINASIKIVAHSESPDDYSYLKLDLESCTLLRENRCDVGSLLIIAYNMSDYDTVKYLIESMTNIELIELFMSSNSYIYFNIFGILLIDAIVKLDDKCVNTVLYNTLGKINDRPRGPTEEHSDIRGHTLTIILQCYYVIKYLTLDAGRKLIAHQHKRYDYFIATDRTHHNLYCKKIKAFHDNLMSFHFRPRGSHTKSAVAS
jgi:hypothetical protein